MPTRKRTIYASLQWEYFSMCAFRQGLEAYGTTWDYHLLAGVQMCQIDCSDGLS